MRGGKSKAVLYVLGKAGKRADKKCKNEKMRFPNSKKKIPKHHPGTSETERGTKAEQQTTKASGQFRFYHKLSCKPVNSLIPQRIIEK